MTIAAGLYLIDTSAWARMRMPLVARRLTAILQAAAAATCLPLDLEDGRSARNYPDAKVIRTRRGEVMTDLPITAAVASRARDLQLALTQRGYHRAVSPVDLIVAAVAAEYGAIVVHYDHDFELIAEVSGARCEWVAPAGSLP